VIVWRKSARARASLAKGGYETWVASADANTLTGFDGGNATRQTHLLLQDGRLRTLTLREWERLQGFPDEWTAMVRSDSARYQQLGNAVAVPMAQWLARRLVAVDAALPMIPERKVVSA
jgi:DNA (cytosine-5)-methyltransferase 1